MIYVSNISKSYDNHNAITNINLEFHSQGFYTVLGPTNSGKSTLLNIIGSLDSPSTGKMMVNLEEHDFHSTKAVDSYRRDFVSYIFQGDNLIDTLSVYDNLYICMNMVETNKQRINLRIEKELVDLDILQVKYQKVSDLSFDEKQRVAVARAALSHAKVIIADEPTVYLNSINEKIILNKLKKISKSTLVIVGTKKVTLANLYSDYIIKMKDSYVIEEINIHNMDKSFKLIPPTNETNQYRYINYIKIALNELIDKKDKYMIIVVGLIIGVFSIFLGLLSAGFGAINQNHNQDTPLIEQAIQTSTDISNLALGVSIVLLISVSILIYSVFKDVLKENQKKIGVLRSLGYSKNSIFNIYDIQNFILGFISAIILTFLIIIFLIINHLYFKVLEVKLIFDWSYLLLAYVLIFNIPFIFSLLPIFKIPNELFIKRISDY